jgi:hypothetical protein
VIFHESFRTDPLPPSVPVNVPVARATFPFGFCGTTWRASILAESLIVSADPANATPLAAATVAAVAMAKAVIHVGLLM